MVKLNQKGITLVTLILVVLVILILITMGYTVLVKDGGIINEMVSNENEQVEDGSQYVIKTNDENVNILVVNEV